MAKHSNGADVSERGKFFSDDVSKTCPPKTYTPVGNFVCLWPHVIESTAGGLIIPAGARSVDSCPTATVIAVGPECKSVKEGDVVVIGDAIMFTPIYVRKWGNALDKNGKNNWAYCQLQEPLITGVISPDVVAEMEAEGIVVR